MANESLQQIEKVKKIWVGRHVKIVGKDHPHFEETGRVVDYKRFGLQYGLEIENDDGHGGFAVFSVKDLKVI